MTSLQDTVAVVIEVTCCWSKRRNPDSLPGNQSVDVVNSSTMEDYIQGSHCADFGNSQLFLSFSLLLLHSSSWIVYYYFLFFYFAAVIEEIASSPLYFEEREKEIDEKRESQTEYRSQRAVAIFLASRLLFNPKIIKSKARLL